MIAQRIIATESETDTTFLVCLDAEFSGPSLYRHSMINLAAVFYEVGRMQCLSQFNAFIEIREGTTWDEETVKSFWSKTEVTRKMKSKIDTRQETLTAKEAMMEFVAFLHQCFHRSRGNMFISSDHIDIEGTWINYYLSLFDLPPLHLAFETFVPLVDLYSLFLGLSNKLVTHVKEFERFRGIKFQPFEAVMRHLNVRERPSSDYDHTALNDSHWNAQSYCILSKHYYLRRNQRYVNGTYQSYPYVQQSPSFFVPGGNQWNAHYARDKLPSILTSSNFS